MITRLKLKPGQKGTKTLLAEHGEALFCVRYRYDEASRTRIKTAEIIVEKVPWTPPVRKYADNDLVPVRIAYAEEDLKASAKSAKGRWNPDVKLWLIRYGKIKGTALEKHIALMVSYRVRGMSSVSFAAYLKAAGINIIRAAAFQNRESGGDPAVTAVFPLLSCAVKERLQRVIAATRRWSGLQWPNTHLAALFAA